MTDSVPGLIRLFAADAWANAEALASLRRASDPPEQARRILAHVVAAEWLWMDRLLGEPPRMAVWPDLAPDDCAAHLEALRGAWPDFLRGLGPDGLSRTVRYTNSKGQEWTSTTADVLSHVLLHSGYHRGQVALLLRAAGAEPAYTDFIHGVRQGLVE